MKKETILVAMLLATGMIYAAESEKNLLTNGGFENSKLTKGYISGWTQSDWGGYKEKGEISLSIQNDAKEGKSAVKITTTGENRNNLTLKQNIAKKIKPGKEYILTFFAKTNDKDAGKAIAYASVLIEDKNKKGKRKRLLYKNSKNKKVTDQWQEIELSFIVPEKFNSAIVILRSNKKDVIFDNAVLLEK